MADTKSIKTRIASIKSTAKSTRALQLVSAAKMQKAQDRSKKAELYAETLYEIVNKMGNIKDFKSPFLKTNIQNNTDKNIAIVVIGTDRGFVGSMISNLQIATYNLKQQLINQHPKVNLLGVSIHKTGLKIIQSCKIKSEAHFADYKDDKKQNELGATYAYLIDKFSNKEIDEIYLVYNKFINTLAQKVETKRILPLSLDELQYNQAEKSSTYLFEPSQSEILNWILPEYFQTSIYSALLSSIASEYSSRMISMKKATDNANDLSDQLTLQYNKFRQASITQQITEIVSGSI